MHPFANVTNVRKDTLLVTLAVDRRWRDGISLAGGSKEGRVRSVERGIKSGEQFLIGVVPIASKPRFSALVYSSWGLIAVENIIPEFSLVDVIEMLSIGHILVIVGIGVLALRFLQHLLKGFQVEGSFLLRGLFLLFQIRKVEILRGADGRRRRVGRRGGCARAFITLK